MLAAVFLPNDKRQKMINSKELRIGNIIGLMVNHNDYNTLPIELPDLNLIHNGNSKNEYYLVPLIPKWLDDFGFTLKKSTFLKDEYYMLGSDFKVEIGITSVRVYYNGHFIKHILKVHELQNIFFCLTGKELSVV